MKKILILIIILGAILRFTHVNWDSFGAFHPDERNISWAVTRIHFFDQLNPKFFAYGGLPIYLYRALGEEVVAVTHNPVWLTDWGHIAVIGRYVSSTLSTISILLIYLVGAAYFSPAVGVLASIFLAFSPWAIQQAHFDTTETMLVFFILLLLLFAKKIRYTSLAGRQAKSEILNIFVLGIIWGLAMAAKTTGALFGVIPLTAIWIPGFLKKFPRKILYTYVLLGIAAIVFYIFSPYTILDFTHFRESMAYESGVALGRFSVVYTLQFFHTPPYLYQLQTMLWQAGPLVIVGIIGLIGMVIQLFRRFHSKFTIHYVLFTIFPFLYFGWVGSWYTKFSRYNVPFLPFVTITAAWFCMMLIKRFHFIGLAFTALLLSSTFLWGLANWTVYIHPHTFLTASRWIYAHVPSNAQLYTEHWNDGLPIDLPDVGFNANYHRESLTVYEPDGADKKMYYADKLVAGDFIILSTRRIWATMPRLGEKYPLTKLFYQRLLDGSLGYKEVATFTSYPQLFGWQINDDSAEESIQVFDHPTVRIFQNTEHLSKEEIYRRLMSSMGS